MLEHISIKKNKKLKQKIKRNKRLVRKKEEWIIIE